VLGISTVCKCQTVLLLLRCSDRSLLGIVPECECQAIINIANCTSHTIFGIYLACKILYSRPSCLCSHFCLLFAVCLCLVCFQYFYDLLQTLTCHSLPMDTIMVIVLYKHRTTLRRLLLLSQATSRYVVNFYYF
jgi:hypothetical protein